MTIKGSLQMSIAIVKAFLADFWWKIWLGHVTVNRGSPMTPYLNSLTPICLFAIQLSWGYDDKGSLQMSIPIFKVFLTGNVLSPVKNWPKICVLGGKWS